MAAIDISSTAAPLNDGVLQLQNGVAMDSTLRNVADQNDTTSPLKLSTTAVQVVSPLRITTDDPSDFYLDCEDGSTNNRFSITRNTASQQVNLNFASNPAGSTTIVGAIRTYVDGVNLSEVMAFREDGNVGIGTTAPTEKVHILGADNTNLLNVSGASGKLRIKGYLSSTYGTLLESTITSGTLMPMTFSASKILLLDGGVSINTTSNTAQLHIKGSGSTSATTSLLVQNSAGSEALKVTDDRSVTISGGTTTISSPKTFINGISTTTSGFGDTGYGMAIDGGIRFGVDAGQSYKFGYWYAISQASNWVNSSKSTIIVGQGANTPNINNITWTSVDITPTFDVNFIGRVGNIIRGIYYNPTITSFVNGVSNQLRAFQSVVGGVFINTSNVEASAILQADSTTQGFLPPRMTNAERAAITTPAIGLMVYCTDAVEGLYVYKSTGWTFVI